MVGENDNPPNYFGLSSKKLLLIGSFVLVGCIVAIVLAVTLPSATSGAKEQPVLWSAPEEVEDDGPSYDNLNNTLIAPAIPCVFNGASAGDVTCHSRVVPCGTIPKEPPIVDIIPPDQNTFCRNGHRIYFGQVYIVQFYNGANRDECWEVAMQVGECWATNPVNGNDYTCQGKCGPGCGNINCGSWARDCLRHDVCSWYYGSSGGAKDEQCGYAYDLAADDFLANCLCTATDGKDKSTCSKWN